MLLNQVFFNHVDKLFPVVPEIEFVFSWKIFSVYVYERRCLSDLENYTIIWKKKVKWRPIQKKFERYYSTIILFSFLKIM